MVEFSQRVALAVVRRWVLGKSVNALLSQKGLTSVYIDMDKPSPADLRF